MLAKQGWRLLHHKDSLVAQILKEKYFPQHEFLEANLGARLSYAWRSTFNARDLLKKSLVWRVDNGQSIRIRKDHWLPSPAPHAVQSPVRILHP
jgi:hypothetical protein